MDRGVRYRVGDTGRTGSTEIDSDPRFTTGHPNTVINDPADPDRISAPGFPNDPAAAITAMAIAAGGGTFVGGLVLLAQSAFVRPELRRHDREAGPQWTQVSFPCPVGCARHCRHDVAMDVNEVLLPGVGLRYEFTNADGDRIGIVARREGSFEVIRYAAGDPDEAEPLFRLTTTEADTVAEILGAPRIAERFADLTKEIPGLSAGQIVVPAASSHAGEPLGGTRARTRTGASIVAVVRGEDVIASPTPDEVLRPGDVLVVIGTREGINSVRQIIEN